MRRRAAADGRVGGRSSEYEPTTLWYSPVRHAVPRVTPRPPLALSRVTPPLAAPWWSSRSLD